MFLLDVASYHMLQALTISTESVYSRVWRYSLTNRLFYEKFFESPRPRTRHFKLAALLAGGGFKETAQREGGRRPQ